MDIDFILKNIPLYIKATQLTLTLAFWGVVLSVLIGFICSLIIYYKVKVLRHIVSGYIELSRNTPLLIQLFFLYYGLPKMGIKLEAYTCAVISLAFLGGSYMAEAFRSGFEAVNTIQIESGLSIGLTKGQLIRYVILPQAFTVAIPALGANAIFILKETSIVSAIALADLMFVTKDLIGMYYKTTEALVMLVVAYLIILLPLSLLLTLIERRVRYAELGN
ncbi:amino ABC transporter, permease, 3-TM region, His/Glu/Gln/Arg/opine family domain protein [Clostridium argentinense CDC 2741]|uniref:Amino ABC transporter, permease, 3-TM region, His/Glu/Gln/Arg/opine family domain protein n=1 Tax=Clostridium argentinense CDC 2741 TaxID=1418104 RepID=A0A0C1U4K1_9CLOT|nr:amino acid ABC transporter permease [Clostridium argentinense]ARC86002.1 polar amino acid ABC transporter permease [Clostridium argentinense]KIE46503.1 amino ABC transporter, permease, 3-TM region, His/Glu/Gln/Arg/opine family domain protein [Clostridium argentinense CDC 2741]NFF38936.1 amino acid ABC transporter permease [Clostridium argentinense]NFP48728.1 amino acid ABC transporter permease [Clostridium argentinense]NFP71004.1 amino acid ABC transporter permease [Clostridium argentinense